MNMGLTKIVMNGDVYIKSLKIYHDDKTEQFKHKFTCPTCGVETMGCTCYDSLDEAIEDAATEWFCHRHYLIECWYDLEFAETIDKKCDLGFGIVVNRFECLKDGLLYPNATNDFRDKKMDECMAECEAMIMAMTDLQASILCAVLDGEGEELNGQACEV